MSLSSSWILEGLSQHHAPRLRACGLFFLIFWAGASGLGDDLDFSLHLGCGERWLPLERVSGPTPDLLSFSILDVGRWCVLSESVAMLGPRPSGLGVVPTSDWRVAVCFWLRGRSVVWGPAQYNADMLTVTEERPRNLRNLCFKSQVHRFTIEMGK